MTTGKGLKATSEERLEDTYSELLVEEGLGVLNKTVQRAKEAIEKYLSLKARSLYSLNFPEEESREQSLELLNKFQPKDDPIVYFAISEMNEGNGGFYMKMKNPFVSYDNHPFTEHFKLSFVKECLGGQKVYDDQQIIFFITKENEKEKGEVGTIHASMAENKEILAERKSRAYFQSDWTSFEGKLQDNGSDDCKNKHIYFFHAKNFGSLLFTQIWTVFGKEKAEKIYQAVEEKLERFPESLVEQIVAKICTSSDISKEKFAALMYLLSDTEIKGAISKNEVDELETGFVNNYYPEDTSGLEHWGDTDSRVENKEEQKQNNLHRYIYHYLEIKRYGSTRMRYYEGEGIDTRIAEEKARKIHPNLEVTMKAFERCSKEFADDQEKRMEQIYDLVEAFESKDVVGELKKRDFSEKLQNAARILLEQGVASEYGEELVDDHYENFYPPKKEISKETHLATAEELYADAIELYERIQQEIENAEEEPLEDRRQQMDLQYLTTNTETQSWAINILSARLHGLSQGKSVKLETTDIDLLAHKKMVLEVVERLKDTHRKEIETPVGLEMPEEKPKTYALILELEKILEEILSDEHPYDKDELIDFKDDFEDIVESLSDRDLCDKHFRKTVNDLQGIVDMSRTLCIKPKVSLGRFEAFKRHYIMANISSFTDEELAEFKVVDVKKKEKQLTE